MVGVGDATTIATSSKTALEKWIVQLEAWEKEPGRSSDRAAVMVNQLLTASKGELITHANRQQLLAWVERRAAMVSRCSTNIITSVYMCLLCASNWHVRHECVHRSCSFAEVLAA